MCISLSLNSSIDGFLWPCQMNPHDFGRLTKIYSIKESYPLDLAGPAPQAPHALPASAAEAGQGARR